MSMDDAVALFQRFDLNGNGTLGFDELRELPGDQLKHVLLKFRLPFSIEGILHLSLTSFYIILHHLTIFIHFLMFLWFFVVDAATCLTPCPGCCSSSVSQLRMSRDSLESLTPIPMAALALHVPLRL